MKKIQIKPSDKAIEELLDLDIELGLFAGDREKELKRRLEDNEPLDALFR